MDPYERLTAINESMKKAVAMLRKNPAAMADAQQFGETGHMRPDSPRRKAQETKALRQMIRHGSSPLASERPDSIHGRINRRSGREIPKTRRRSPQIETDYSGSGSDTDAIGFPGGSSGYKTEFDSDTARTARGRGVRLPADKAEFKKKYGIK
jgi:hypothetical protein